MKKSNLREVRNSFPEGSAPFVVEHAIRQRRRGRNPAMTYKIIRNPSTAAKAARRDSIFYQLMLYRYDNLANLRFATMIAVDKKYQPVRLRHIGLWHGRLSDRFDDGLELVELLEYIILGRLLATGVTDMIRCFEDLLDDHYLMYDYFAHMMEMQIQKDNKSSPIDARLDFFDELANQLVNAIGHVQTSLNNGLPPLGTRDIDVNPN